MERTKSYVRLLKLGFLPEQAEHLCQLRRVYTEIKQTQAIQEQRRLEFARWLVVHGRLTDSFPLLTASLPRGIER